MGLQTQLTDVSSDSIPILLLSLIATCVTHLRSLLSTAFLSVGLSHPHHHQIDDDYDGLIAVSHHLSLNDGTSFSYDVAAEAVAEEDDDDDENDDGPACVFCLCGLKHGDRVRQLDCRHVFHKECLDGWIDQMKFNCPLCRSPLAPEWRRVDDHHLQRVAREVSAR